MVENGFLKIRLAIGHGRLDHRTTAASCTKVNLLKEVNTSERNRKKRNSGGCLKRESIIINKNDPISKPLATSNDKNEPRVQCTDYAILRMDEARKRKEIAFNKKDLLIWKQEMVFCIFRYHIKKITTNKNIKQFLSDKKIYK